MNNTFARFTIILVCAFFSSSLLKEDNNSIQESSLFIFQEQDTLSEFYAQSFSNQSDVLMLEFNEPQQQNASTFQRLTGKTIFCYNANDSSAESGYSYVLVAMDEWGKVFGLELSITSTIDAGNSIGAGSFSREIKNKDNLKGEIIPLLKDFYIQNDPKFHIYNEASADSCQHYFN